MHLAEWFAIAGVFLGVILGVPALVFAIKTIRDSLFLKKELLVVSRNVQTQIESLVTHGDRLEELFSSLMEQRKNAEKSTVLLTDVVKSLPTTSIGCFPEYLSKITNLINNSNGPVRIISPVAGHGSFSVPHEWEKTQAALAGLHRRNHSLSLVCPNRGLRTQLIYMQYPQLRSDWANLVYGDTELARMMKDFIPKSINKELADFTSDEFMELIMKDDDNILDQTFRHAKVTETSILMPHYMWIAGEQEAIFALPIYYEDPQSQNPSGFNAEALHTRDKGFVRMLIETYKGHERDASFAKSKTPDPPAGGSIGQMLLSGFPVRDSFSNN